MVSVALALRAAPLALALQTYLFTKSNPICVHLRNLRIEKRQSENCRVVCYGLESRAPDAYTALMREGGRVRKRVRLPERLKG